MPGKLLLGLSWVLLANILTKALWFFAIAVLVRGLGAQAFGALTTAWATGGLLVAIADAGYGSLFLREASRRPEQTRWWLRRVLLIKLACSLPLALLAAWLTTRTLAAEPSAREWLALSLAAATPLLDHFHTLFLSVGQVRERLDVYARHRIGYFAVLLLAWLTIAPSGDLAAVCLVFGAVTALHVLVFALASRRLLPAAGPPPARLPPAGEGLRLMLIAVLALAYYRCEVWLLAALDSATAATLYSVAYQVILLVYAIPSVVNTVLLPDLYRDIGRPEQQQARFDQACRYFTLIGMFAFVVLMPQAVAAMRLIGGEQTVAGGPTLAVLSLMVLLLPATAALQMLVAHDRLTRRVLCDACGIAATLLLGIALVPLGSSVGMAAGAVAGYALTCALGLGSLRPLTGVSAAPLARTLAHVALACMPFAAAALLLHWPSWIEAPLSAAGGVALLSLTRFWNGTERALFARLWVRAGAPS